MPLRKIESVNQFSIQTPGTQGIVVPNCSSVAKYEEVNFDIEAEKIV